LLLVYAVAPDSPIQSFPDLLSRANAGPGKLTYTITSLGSIYPMLTAWVRVRHGDAGVKH
jgi:tripartite-type tricarboxylate transporter receptor subunit TctC